MRVYRNFDYECTTMQMLFFQEFETSPKSDG